MQEAKAIQKNIKIYRKKQNLSRKQLAQKAKISIFTVINLELGRNKDPLFSTILKVSKALGVSIEKLMQ